MNLKACLRWLNPIPLIGLTLLTWFSLASPYALAQELATIEFDGLEDVYQVGDTVFVDLVEIVPPYRTQNVDLWFAVLMPSGDLIFMTSTSNPFNLSEPFKNSVEASETEHQLLEFDVPADFGGNYTFYALYVEEGKDLITDGIEKVGRSNLAFQTVTLCNEPSENPFMCGQEPGNEPPSEPKPPGQTGNNPLLPPNPFKPAFTFTPVSHAKANTGYTSNSVVISDVDGSVKATVRGGNATLIKNGIDTGLTSISVKNGDTLAIKTLSPSIGRTKKLTLRAGKQSTNWTVTTAAIPAFPIIPGQMSGYTASQFEVSESGAATYSIPITVPPGTAGIQPNLSLNYSSQGSNGLLGMGFSLGGLSVISRCPATRAQDNGLIDPIDFDINDRFCLDGERLMAVQGVYGANNTIYYTEQNSFKKVISSGKVGNGPAAFTVRTKSGLIMQYGYTADSRIKPPGNPNVLSWALNRIQDTKGNYLKIFYEEKARINGEYRPIRIDYTGNVKTGLTPYNSVHFVYGPRTDIVPKYISGSQLKTTQRLIRIETWEGSDIFRKYILGYQYDTVTKRSRLIKVTECGTNYSCFKPTIFNWQPITNNHLHFNGQGSGMWQGNHLRPKNNVIGDFNGDGKADIATFGDQPNYWHICLSTGKGFLSCDMIWRAHNGGTGNNITADFNGDGLSDLAAYAEDAQKWHVCLSTGKGFSCSFWTGNTKGVTHQAVGDFNGDGKTDMAMPGFGINKWQVCLSTGKGFLCSIWQAHNGGSQNNITADFNGDGLADLAGYSEGQQKWHVCLSTGKGFSCSFWKGNLKGITHQAIGDFNGDGQTDMAMPGFGIGKWRVCLSTGNGFSCAIWRAHNGGLVNNVMGDFNGDGKTDLAGYAKKAKKWHVCLSTGKNFSSRAWKGHGAYKNNMIGDFNGDGQTDLAGYAGNSRWHVTLSGIPYYHSLKQITNGHGATTKIHYKPLTDNSVYTKENNAVFPQVDVQMPLYVVSSYQVTNGLIGENKIYGENKIHYHYTGAKMDLRGRGFRGFSQTKVTDETAGISQTIFYQRDYRYISTKVRRIEQRLEKDGTLISETNNVSELKDYGNGVHFSRVKQSVEKKYEATGPLKGQLITTTITKNQFDDFGNPTRIEINYGQGYTETTVNTYTNNKNLWILGRLTRAVVTKTAPGQSSQTRTSAFEYDAASGLLTKEIIEPNNPKLRLAKTYQYDNYGNITKSIISGPSIEPRSHTTVYDQKGRYVIVSKNALGHKETKTYYKGNLESITGPNGLKTQWKYDGFGRPILEIRADGTRTRTVYRLCGVHKCPRFAKYFVRTDTSGAARIITYYDVLDREIGKRTVGFGGRVIDIDQRYNVRGEVKFVSEPHFAAEQPLWTVNHYDTIGRLIKQTAPGLRVTKTSYHGLTTIITNALNQKNTRKVNVLGQLVTSIDNLNNAITYTYDGFGNLIELRDPAGNTTEMQYDIRGNKISMYDADTGQTTYTYNALGELISQTDAKGQTVRMQYDLLGRLIQRNEPEGVTTWEYDTQPKGIGKLATVTGPNNYQATYRYDSFGRLDETQTTLNGQSFFVANTYDQFGRTDTLTYPSGFAVRNQYDKQGYLLKVQHATNKKLFWRAKRMNARGQLEQIRLGNGLITNKVYQPSTGHIQSIQTGNRQNLAFHFDKLGNLTKRVNRPSNLVETFQYDGLNRLKQTAVGPFKTSLQYDKLGNITFKSGVGKYTYGTRPHAVTAINGAKSNQYRYDANGNRIKANGQTIAYTSFNKPRRIKQGNKTLEFQYGPNYSRYQQKVTDGGLVTTTTYIAGGLFEREVSQSWEKHTHYIFAGGESVAIYTEKNHGIEQETRYLHKDHLGSIDTITDENGQVVEKLSFDAWGQRRNPKTWGALTEAQLQKIAERDLTTDRGFTGHEHLDEVQLIHMNGRIYDPVIGRFLSADPFVQAPSFSQSLNRYTYVMNNPLSLVDPSGFWSFGDVLKDIGNAIVGAAKAVVNFVKDNLKPIVAIAAGVALGFVTAGIGSAVFGAAAFGFGTFGGAVLSGAGFGFGSAFAGTMLNGGSIGSAFKAGIKGAVIGGVTAGLTYGVGSFFAGPGAALGKIAPIAKIIAHGVVGGATRIAQGGRFEHGFLAGGFSAGFSPMVNYIPNMAGRVVASAVIGGTAEELGGGKFANGAVTGAFVRLFNHELHYNRETGILELRDDNDKIIDKTNAISGPHGNGQLPPGEYQVGDAVNVPPERASFCDPSGNCWWQSITPKFETNRNSLGIHPDGGQYGTLGCIGVTERDTSQLYNELRTHPIERLIVH